MAFVHGGGYAGVDSSGIYLGSAAGTTMTDCTITGAYPTAGWSPDYNLFMYQQQQRGLAERMAERREFFSPKTLMERVAKETINEKHPDIKPLFPYNCEFHDLLNGFDELVKQF